jgi:hypothetical protein
LVYFPPFWYVAPRKIWQPCFPLVYKLANPFKIDSFWDWFGFVALSFESCRRHKYNVSFPNCKLPNAKFQKDEFPKTQLSEGHIVELAIYPNDIFSNFTLSLNPSLWPVTEAGFHFTKVGKKITRYETRYFYSGIIFSTRAKKFAQRQDILMVGM